MKYMYSLITTCISMLYIIILLSDTYVKAYLVGGSKVIQKKKTHVVKGTYDPYFRRKIKYSACNIHGRAIKVTRNLFLISQINFMVK